MTVLFLTEGGASAGHGHVTRCSAIAEAVAELGGTPRFAIRGDASVLRHVAQFQAECVDWLEEGTLATLLADVQAVVVDSYSVSKSVAEQIAQAVESTYFIDDNDRIPYPESAQVINGTLYAEEFHSRAGKESALLGSRYIPLRKPFQQSTPRDIRETVQRVLIIPGGSDPMNIGLKSAFLVRQKLPEAQVVLVAPNPVNAIGIQVVSGLDAEGMKKEMLAADFAVSAGGQTLYELAATGTPALAIAVAENQMKNVTGFHRAGVHIFAGWWNDADLERKLGDMIDHISRLQARGMMGIKGMHVVDGQGARRIARSIVEGA